MEIKFKKLIVISLVFTIIFSVLPTITFASDASTKTTTLEDIGMFLSGIAKVIYLPVKFIIFLIPGGIIQIIIETIASVGGKTERLGNIRQNIIWRSSGYRC